MRRHEYAAGAAYTPQEQLLFQRQFLRSQQQQLPAANIKRIRQPIYQRRYSYESEPENVVPIYSKFIYPTQQQPLLMGLNESMSSLASGEYDYSDYIYEEDVRAMPAYVVEEPLAASKVVHNLNALGRLLELLQRWPLPRLSFNTACICVLIAIFIAPRTCAQSLLFPAFRLFFGTLYPAYASYKAVRTKNVKEYVKWMMYWIVFAFFTCIETFTDIFLSWFPLYYEVKVVIVLWLLSPVTKGSSTLYRKFVHPMLTRREQEIDEYLNQARERGYSAVLQLGSKGVNYATNVIMQTAIKLTTNQPRGLQNSQSAIELHAPRDMLDGNEQFLPRSSSLSEMETYAELEYQGNDVLLLPAEAGAARLRDMPARKTRNNKQATTSNKRGTRASSKEANSAQNTNAIRPRRKLREPTPDMDVDVYVD